MRIQQVKTVIIVLVGLWLTGRPASAAPESEADSLYQIAQSFYSSQEFDSTIHYCSLAIDADSTLIDAYFSRGASLEKKGKLDLAMPDYIHFATWSQLFEHNAGYLKYAFARIDLDNQSKKMKFIPAERLRFEPPGNDWKAAFQTRGQDEALIEYIHKDEKVKNWSELVSTRFYPGSGAADRVQKIYSSLRSAAMEQCSKSSLTELISGRLNIVYEWNNQGCVSDTVSGEYELARLFGSEQGVHRIAFACRDKKRYQAIKSQWFDILLNTVVRQKP